MKLIGSSSIELLIYKVLIELDYKMHASPLPNCYLLTLLLKAILLSSNQALMRYVFGCLLYSLPYDISCPWPAWLWVVLLIF